MKVLVSKHAQEKIMNLSSDEQDSVSRILRRMETERFPKIASLLRSDVADEDGRMIRDFENIRIVYEFVQHESTAITLVITVMKRKK